MMLSAVIWGSICATVLSAVAIISVICCTQTMCAKFAHLLEDDYDG